MAKTTYSLTKGLRELRQGRGLTCKDIEEACGLARGQCAQFESTSAPMISLRMLVKLADFLDVSLDDLVARRFDARKIKPVEYCGCDLRHRQWDMTTGRCLTCGNRYPLVGRVSNELAREVMKQDKTI